ncbi:hypothetical protein CSC17_3766 [Klebsiella oxytoca]|nr:hypothetical protein CSC17_3766 [Klebsiella oxytoca]EUC87321.1 hypothetical protein HMPREF1570_0572 [Klebsiella oxytoca KA-2]EUC92869.1 hypothetical protein HMPREF1569_5452 [Klebsiella oxytoca OK-1]
MNSYKNLDHMFVIAWSENVSRLAKPIFRCSLVLFKRSKA